jgi:hypothetical protein
MYLGILTTEPLWGEGHGNGIVMVSKLPELLASSTCCADLYALGLKMSVLPTSDMAQPATVRQCQVILHESQELSLAVDLLAGTRQQGLPPGLSFFDSGYAKSFCEA